MDGPARALTALSATNGGSGAEIALDLLVLLLLILLNAFFAASEIAVISLNDSLVRRQAEEGDPTARRIHALLAQPGRFLATIQVGITLAGFLASAFAAESFAAPIASAIDPAGAYPFVHTATVVVLTILLSFVSLVFGELVPKRLALKNPEKVSKATVGVLTAVGAVLRPFVALLTGVSNLVLRLLGVDPREREKTVTEEEIRMMVDVGEEAGAIHEQEKQLIENIFEFNDKAVSEVMRHRTEIAALPVDATFDEVLAFASKEKYTRIPVYEETIDSIVGILHVKDLLYVAMEGLSKPFTLRGMIRPAYYAPESKHIDKLFRDMQRKRVQLAVIIDEYGGTAGLVTMEDLLEEIVGSLQDEYDEEEQEMVLAPDGTFTIEGKTPLEDVAEALGATLPCDDYDTMGGFVMGLLGRIPEEHEKPAAEYRNLRMKVLEMDDKRISKVHVEVVPAEEDAEGKADEDAAGGGPEDGDRPRDRDRGGNG